MKVGSLARVSIKVRAHQRDQGRRDNETRTSPITFPRKTAQDAVSESSERYWIKLVLRCIKIVAGLTQLLASLLRVRIASRVLRIGTRPLWGHTLSDVIMPSLLRVLQRVGAFIEGCKRWYAPLRGFQAV